MVRATSSNSAPEANLGSVESRWRALFMLLILGAVLVGALSSQLGDASLTRVLEADVIRVGYAIEPPYAFVTAGGEVTGESPEVARRIVERLGVGRIQWLQMEFNELIPALESGRLDLVAAGLFVTPERAERVRFSRPTFQVRPALLVPAGNPRRLRSYLDAAARPETRIAILAGAVDETLLRRLGVAPERLERVPDALTGRMAIQSGLADVFMLSAPTFRWLAEHGQLVGTELIFAPADDALVEREGYGRGAFAFRLQDRRLARAWDEAARDFIGRPEHVELLSRFGFTAAEIPKPSPEQTPHER